MGGGGEINRLNTNYNYHKAKQIHHMVLLT